MDHTDMSEQERDVLYNLLFADLVFHSIGVDIIETRKYDFCWGERRRSKEKVTQCVLNIHKQPQYWNLEDQVSEEKVVQHISLLLTHVSVVHVLLFDVVVMYCSDLNALWSSSIVYNCSQYTSKDQALVKSIVINVPFNNYGLVS